MTTKNELSMNKTSFHTPRTRGPTTPRDPSTGNCWKSNGHMAGGIQKLISFIIWLAKKQVEQYTNKTSLTCTQG